MDRVYLKSRAKAVLKKHYLILLIVSALIAVTGGGIGDSFGSNRITYKFQGTDSFSVVNEIASNPSTQTFLSLITGFFVGLLTVFSLLLLLAALLVSFPLQVGGARIYIDSADGEHPPLISRLAFAFTGGNYVNIFVAGLLTELYTFLWYLLFIIPGIVKSYSYSMVPYILADSPEMRASDAIRLSRDMMHGHKWEMFILDLSFIGWNLLAVLVGSFTFGLGGYLVLPYIDATHAQFYLQLRGGYTVHDDVIDATVQI